jgi:hypothetical protein
LTSHWWHELLRSRSSKLIVKLNSFDWRPSPNEFNEKRDFVPYLQGIQNTRSCLALKEHELRSGECPYVVFMSHFMFFLRVRFRAGLLFILNYVYIVCAL